jgi:hypothetical protein
LYKECAHSKEEGNHKTNNTDDALGVGLCKNCQRGEYDMGSSSGGRLRT